MTIANSQDVPVNVVGSSTFGRYPKISDERTYNMFISDDWLINYAGFKKRIQIFPEGQGRGLFNSVRGNLLISVISSAVYRHNGNLSPIFIGNLDTTSGEVFIDENLSNQICIVDGDNAYIYNYATSTFTKQTLTFLGNPIVPSFVCYHNSFFLIGSSQNSDNSQNWYAFERATDSTISLNTPFSLQTKPDSALAVVRIPGRGNNVLVLGSTVCEVWTQLGALENYRRVQSFNIDMGVVSLSTIAASNELVCWLAKNEDNGPCIMVTDGGAAKQISSDGIDALMATITHPEDSAAFFYRQDGHLFYQLTFYNPADNVSLIHDFSTSLFFHVSDEDLNYHPARQVVYFNENTYFISLNDASLYQMDTDFVTYDYSVEPSALGEEIPRIRICKSIRKEDSSTFRIGRFTFWIEQGVNNYNNVTGSDTELTGLMVTQEGGFMLTQEGGFLLTQQGGSEPIPNIPRVDFSFSKNGNQSFSNVVGHKLNTAGKFANQIRWNRLGRANEFTPQLRFVGFQRFVAKDGVASIY